MRKEAGNHDDISRTITHGLIGERTRADIHDGPEHNTRQSEAGYIDARPPPPIRRNLLATHGRTIHSGQSLPKWDVRATSSFPLLATEERTSRNVSNVPISDSCTAKPAAVHGAPHFAAK